MKQIRFMVVAAVLATAGVAMAQDAAGPGKGPGPAASAPAPGTGMGMGPGGMRGGRGPMGRWGADFTHGWSLMTPQERNEHRDRMQSMKTFDECKAYMDQHREQMAARAKEKGKSLPTPRREACQALKP